MIGKSEILAMASGVGIPLDASDIEMTNGEPTINGMALEEWLDVMGMD